jgi:hypothetical protein
MLAAIKAIEKAGKYLIVLLVILVLGWAAIALDVNVGRIINRVLGKKPQKQRVIRNNKGDQVGTRTGVVRDRNPLRDKGEVKLQTGDTVKLPKGVKDTDVKSVTQISGEVYQVETKHERLTAVFDRDNRPRRSTK